MKGLRRASSDLLIYFLIVLALLAIVYASRVARRPTEDHAAWRPDPRAARHPGAIMGPSVKDAVRAAGGDPADVDPE
jgi:hypothetical protein